MIFKQAKEFTPVVFRASRRNEPNGRDAEITAVFPCENADYEGNAMTCYSTFGQHGGCTTAWYHTTRAAKPHEYAHLINELEGATYGYHLKIYKRIQPFMREARMNEARRNRASLKSAN